MTIYNINDLVMFDSQQNHVATLADNRNYIQLSTPASRCFELLISNSDQLIDKGKLLDYGWRDHGVFVTDNSLNQAILSIRKALKKLGLEENFIVTVPRIGYRIGMHNIITIMDSGDKAKPILSKQISVETKENMDAEIVGLLSNNKGKTPLSYICACLLIIVFSWTTCLSLFMNNTIMSGYHSINNELKYYRIAEIHNGINLYINDDYDINNAAMTRVIDKITNNKDLTNLILRIGNINDIYINGSYTKNIISLFLCSQKIELITQACYSYVFVE